MQERIFIIKQFFESGSVVTVQRNFVREFNCKHRKKPSRSVVVRLVKKFEQTGSVWDNRVAAGAKRTVRTKEVEKKARKLVKENPRTTITLLAQRLGVSWSTTYRILTRDIRLFPYKVQVVQKLTSVNKEKRLHFAKEFSQFLATKPRSLNEIWFTDECHFWLNGYVNKQNMRLWSETNLNAIEEKPLHPEKVTVWAAISSHGIIGPCFIRETVNSDNYHTLLTESVIPELENRGHLKKAIFQQDGAKLHTSDENLLLLRNVFKKREISNHFPNLFNCGWNWPPYSPDLNPCDYFLWGYLKDRVYVNNPTTCDDLEMEILQVMRDIPSNIYNLVLRNFVTRLEQVVEVDGGHFENIN